MLLSRRFHSPEMFIEHVSLACQEIKDIQMKALILLRYGYLARIILTSLEQANSLNDYWKLSHLIHKFFKFLRTHMEGYFNLELNLIPSSYDEGYLDEACHHIKITLHKQSQERMPPRNLKDVIIPRDIKRHMRLWRACAISTN